MKTLTPHRLARLLSTGSIVASLGAASVCVIPFVALLFGVGGLGFLARYSSLGPMALWTATGLVAIGLAAILRRSPSGMNSCQLQALRRSRLLVLIATAFTLALHAAEHLLLPAFGS